MRSRGYFWLAIVLSSALLFPRAASAETIRITSGFFEIGEDGTGPYNLVGDRRGFRLFGTISTDFAHFGAICPDSTGCIPGTVARLPHAWTGLDFVGPRATLDGVFYEIVNSLTDQAFASVLFFADIPLPAFTPSGTTVLQTPFTFRGGFTVQPRDGEPGEITQDDLVGAGLLTTRWARSDLPELDSQWEVRFARYDFFGAAPIPEPTTLVLAGIAGAAGALARRKRRAR
jgi:hypothetical protein